MKKFTGAWKTAPSKSDWKSLMFWVFFTREISNDSVRAVEQINEQYKEKWIEKYPGKWRLVSCFFSDGSIK